jgi:hypothetical protein
MEAIIKKYNIDTIWHFTDKSNLESIIQNNGLFSLGELERRGIDIPSPGGNDWSHDADKVKGLHEYVHLAFIRNHPMLFRAKQDERIPNPVWLGIEADIILEKNVRFCSDVSNKSGVAILSAEDAKAQVDFEVLFERLDWRDTQIKKRRQDAEKSEILVPGFVAIDKIKGYIDG